MVQIHSFAIDDIEANLVLTASLNKQQKGIIMLGLDNWLHTKQVDTKPDGACIN
jgi:hypothetical protein